VFYNILYFCIVLCVNVNANKIIKSNQIKFIGFAGTNLRMSSILIAGPKLWNVVPTNIQLSTSLFIFKRCF